MLRTLGGASALESDEGECQEFIAEAVPLAILLDTWGINTTLTRYFTQAINANSLAHLVGAMLKGRLLRPSVFFFVK